MATIDRFLDRILTPIRGARCTYCWRRPGRGTFDQFEHEYLAHPYGEPCA